MGNTGICNTGVTNSANTQPIDFFELYDKISDNTISQQNLSDKDKKNLQNNRIRKSLEIKLSHTKDIKTLQKIIKIVYFLNTSAFINATTCTDFTNMIQCSSIYKKNKPEFLGFICKEYEHDLDFVCQFVSPMNFVCNMLWNNKCGMNFFEAEKLQRAQDIKDIQNLGTNKSTSQSKLPFRNRTANSRN